MARFALIGCGGYVAPRHMKAIYDTGNELVAACDVHDSVGILDRFAPECKYFKEVERLDRHLYLLKREGQGIGWFVVCTPNYLHDAHVRLGLRIGANVICEKPLVLSPWNLDQLQEMEVETGSRVFTLMQLRYLTDLISLRKKALKGHHKIELNYITPRGPWYSRAWKGQEKYSGGPIFNIGIHFLDALIWLFGKPIKFKIHEKTSLKARGTIQLAMATVDWFLSLNRGDLPSEDFDSFRSLVIDGKSINLSNGFTNLHTRVYQETLTGNGIGIDDARPAIELAYQIQQHGL